MFALRKLKEDIQHQYMHKLNIVYVNFWIIEHADNLGNIYATLVLQYLWLKFDIGE